MSLCWTQPSMSTSLLWWGAKHWMLWLQALSFGEHPHSPSENDQWRQDVVPCVPAPCSDSKATFSIEARRWFPSLASLPCCDENLVGLFISNEKLMSHCLVEQHNFVWSTALICLPISGEDLFMVLSKVIL